MVRDDFYLFQAVFCVVEHNAGHPGGEGCFASKLLDSSKGGKKGFLDNLA